MQINLTNYTKRARVPKPDRTQWALVRLAPPQPYSYAPGVTTYTYQLSILNDGIDGEALHEAVNGNASPLHDNKLRAFITPTL